MDEVVDGSVTRTYAYGLQRVSENQKISGTWTPSFYGYDGHGNVRFLTNGSGAVANTYQFDAFGNQIASAGRQLRDPPLTARRLQSEPGMQRIVACPTIKLRRRLLRAMPSSLLAPSCC